MENVKSELVRFAYELRAGNVGAPEHEALVR